VTTPIRTTARLLHNSYTTLHTRSGDEGVHEGANGNLVDESADEGGGDEGIDESVDRSIEGILTNDLNSVWP
jgi:hypothetical protein